MLTLETVELDKIYTITDDVLALMKIKRSGKDSAYYDGRLILVDRNHIKGSEIIRFAKRPQHKVIYSRKEFIEMTPRLTEEMLNRELSKYPKSHGDRINGYVASIIYHKVTIDPEKHKSENKIEYPKIITKRVREDGWSRID
jgi:hypothetical protein